MLKISTLQTVHPQPRLTALLSVADNIAPVSWHMPFSKVPFVYAVAMRQENYSHVLMTQKKEFSLNFLDYKYVDIIDKLGGAHGDKIDKFNLSKLTKKSASIIESTLIEEAYTIFECKVIDILNYGDHDIFVSKVVLVHTNPDKKPEPTLFLGGGKYATTSTIKRAKRE